MTHRYFLPPIFLVILTGLAAIPRLLLAAPAPPAAAPGGCIPAHVQSRTRAAGAESTVYRLGPGTVTAVTPLPGFSAAVAGPAARAATGLGSLPAAVRELAASPRMRYDPGGSLCRPGGIAAPAVITGSVSPDWGGLALYQPGRAAAYWQAAASWTVPHFLASCGPDSDHSMWTGIGGYSAAGGGLHVLMQAGVDTAAGDGTSAPDAVYPFWEVLSFRGISDPAQNNIEPIVQVPLALNTGDSVTIVTEYLAAQDRVVFWFLDRTTGQYKLYSLTSLYGHLPSFFYDGQSAEVVGENGDGSAYRQPAGDLTSFWQADFNSGLPASAYPAAIRSISMEGQSGRIIDKPSGLRTAPGPGVLHSSQWNDQWRGCG